VVTQNDSLYALNAAPTPTTCSNPPINYMPLLPILNNLTGQTHSAVACSGIGAVAVQWIRWSGFLALR
jgi:hypothetical protein